MANGTKVLVTNFDELAAQTQPGVLVGPDGSPIVPAQSKAEDSPHTSGDLGVFILAVRNDTPGQLAGTNLDYSPISVDSVARVLVTGQEAHDAPITGRPFNIGVRANSGVPTAVSTAGDAVWAWGDLNGRQIAGLSPPNATTVAPANATSTAEEASRVVKASAGVLYGFTAYNNNAATRYIQLYDSATLPADAVVPVLTVPVAAQSVVSYAPGVYGRAFTAGIVIANSTTDTTKTIGSADSLFDVQYV